MMRRFVIGLLFAALAGTAFCAGVVCFVTGIYGLLYEPDKALGIFNAFAFGTILFFWAWMLNSASKRTEQ